MRTESNIKPSAFSVEKCGDIAEIVLFENIEEKEHDGEMVFAYDEYCINVPYRENLQSSIEQNLDAWREKAIEDEKEKLAAAIRAERDRLLTESDYIMLSDYKGVDNATKTAWKQYRQALRDITGQDGFPYNIIYPKKP